MVSRKGDQPCSLADGVPKTMHSTAFTGSSPEQPIPSASRTGCGKVAVVSTGRKILIVIPLIFGTRIDT
jgi:hypothetical protein